MKAKITGTEIKTIGLPETGILRDGRAVSNYHLLPDEILAEEGWVEVEDIKPTYDPETHQLIHNGHRVTEGKVVVDYTLVELPPPPPPEPDYNALFRDAVSKATTLQQLKDALLGTTGPGAQPRIGRP